MNDQRSRPSSAQYDESYARVYDTIFRDDSPEVSDAVAALASFAGDPGASILEFGAGTGRIAIPLSRSYVVTAVEPSPFMRERFSAKRADSETLTMVPGDFSTSVDLPGQAVVLSVLGTLACLLDLAEQRKATQAMAEYVAPGGWLVLESFNPVPLSQLSTEPLEIPLQLDDHGTRLVSDYRRGDDGVMRADHLWKNAHGDEVRFSEEVMPAPASLIAEWMTDSGLQAEHVWGDWNGTAFDEASHGLFVLAARRPR